MHKVSMPPAAIHITVDDESLPAPDDETELELPISPTPHLDTLKVPSFNVFHSEGDRSGASTPVSLPSPQPERACKY